MANHEFRRTGRTTRRLVAALAQVLNRVGDWVEIMDHHDLRNSHLSLAADVSTHLKMLGVDHERDQTKIRVNPLRKKRENPCV